jgi:hypothetical protein
VRPALEAKAGAIRTVRDLRSRLADDIDGIRNVVASFFKSPNTTPGGSPAAWRSSRTFLLGIARPRGLSRGDTALVGWMILGSMDRDAVAKVLNVERGLIDRMIRKPAIHQALLDWQKYRTIPHLLQPRRRRQRRAQART